MRIKALLERKRGEWEEIKAHIHPDFPDTAMFMDKDRKVKVLDIACGLTWGGQFYSKSYTQMLDIVKINHSTIDDLKLLRKEWTEKRIKTVIDAAEDRNNQELIEYISKLLDSEED